MSLALVVGGAAYAMWDSRQRERQEILRTAELAIGPDELKKSRAALLTYLEAHPEDTEAQARLLLIAAGLFDRGIATRVMRELLEGGIERLPAADRSELFARYDEMLTAMVTGLRTASRTADRSHEAQLREAIAIAHSTPFLGGLGWKGPAVIDSSTLALRRVWRQLAASLWAELATVVAAQDPARAERILVEAMQRLPAENRTARNDRQLALAMGLAQASAEYEEDLSRARFAARAALEHSTNLDSAWDDRPKVKFNLAIMEARLGRIDDALQLLDELDKDGWSGLQANRTAFRSALRRDRAAPSYLALMKRSSDAFDRHDWSAVEKHAREAIRVATAAGIGPDDDFLSSARHYIGLARFNRGDYDGAADMLRKLSADDPTFRPEDVRAALAAAVEARFNTLFNTPPPAQDLSQ